MWHVDATHNTFITTGNAGPESTTAEVSLFYNGGKNKYRLERKLSPGQQLWLDVGQVIHDQLADSDGQTLPSDTMSGSYELRDLDHQTVGQLYEGKLIIDKTYGHASYGCGTCCGYSVPTLLPDPFAGPPGIDNTDVMQSTEQCGGELVDLADDAYNWQSTNTSVATLPTKVLHTVANGSATGSGEVYVQADKPAPRCPMAYYTPQQPVTVCDFTVGPSTVYAQNCTGQSQNNNNFSATITPSSCLPDSVKSKCGASWVSGNIDLVGSPTCVFNLGPPSATVTYFAGPKLPNGSAGTFDVTFDLYFDSLKADIARYVTATSECP